MPSFPFLTDIQHMATNQERFSFILLHDLLGFSPDQIAARLSLPVHDIETLQESPLYMVQKSEALEAFRRHSIRSAADELELAAHEATVFLRSVPGNLRMKDHLRIKVAMDLLDRVPETSRTLRQHVRVDKGFISDDQLGRLTSQLELDQRARLIFHEPEEQTHQEDLRALIDVEKK